MPTHSAYPLIDVPDVDLWTFLFERKDRPFPDDKVIYVDPDANRSYTFGLVRSTALEFGKGLRAVWEWKKGDVLAVYTPNCIDTPALIWGTHWAGGIISPANPGYTVDELAFQLKDSGAKALATQKPFLKTALEACKKVGIDEDRIILIGDERDETMKFKHFTGIRNLAGTSRYRKANIDPKKDLAFLVYSSGTTGHPKGVMLSHSNIVANTLMLTAGEAGNLTWNGGPKKEGDKILAFLPFFHIYGLTCLIHQSIYGGLQLIVMPKFELEKFCSHIQSHAITMIYIVPPVILLMAKSPVIDKYDLSSIRMMNSGAAPLTRDLVNAVYKRLKIPIKQGYGLSETSPTTHAQPWEQWDKTIGSVGKLLPNQTAKYMSEDEREVPAGQTGELWIKGPNIFLGYLNNAAGTQNALTADGYFKTGDVGYQDKDGNFYITDRIKELIKYKGFQVPPAELEGYLIGHPDIDDVAVIGVEDREQATEVPRAYVVPKRGVERGKEKEREIAGWLAQRVAGHKKLRGGVRFVDEIPKSVSGKILRRVLKAQAAAEEEEEEKKKKMGAKAKL
ncbi:putative 4-coumarate-CoA ligase [Drepanopeziza brunnea f. sp. 'multigermtubi' MB_m1]|uniref:Putative 4-coumarate-CoA ligase n=1 Tax=Marssonina brunnea f. sp. multigermtubi (strain MB_m1) TaxID=1072389 RepID=K1X210_MARBU|nr:putative 4-coumarate-CoA ligase [Drepanopeziza brunnea f. sp. 'multigermtubi' MB_m1]EKD19236.1 putative 4-coumarate-CoA ligase [Drepanopeziza brunnea f. sp. 'multigermtubi' MB_m1]